MVKNSGALYLLLAILFEVSATTSIKLSDGFTNMAFNIAVAIGVAGSIYFLGRSLDQLPLSIAYAVWVGLGTALITLIDLVIFHAEFNIYRTLGLMLVVGGVAALNHFSGDSDVTEERENP
ncbi:DMT family transporter [Virgibacillus kekensis]|uniref:DMT family transporter n=1 Tax=Virgibacillus kekensis TaxID=202261 RepID=A0ABV9DMC3_9BACI